MLDLIVLHGEFSIFTVRRNFWYQIYRNRRKKVLCSRLSLITLTIRPKGVGGTKTRNDKWKAAQSVNNGGTVTTQPQGKQSSFIVMTI